MNKYTVYVCKDCLNDALQGLAILVKWNKRFKCFECYHLAKFQEGLKVGGNEKRKNRR